MNKFVSESLYEFQRGQEPKEALKIGGEYEKIKSWLSQFLYKSQWTINEDWAIDVVKGDFIASGVKIPEFPEFIDFNNVVRDFIVSGCELEILSGFPKRIEGDLIISDNKIVSLNGCPQYVGGDFSINRNKVDKFTEAEIRKICEVKGKVYV